MQWHVKFAFPLLLAALLAGCWRISPAGHGRAPAVEFDEGPNLVFAADGGEVHITPQPTATVPADAIPADLPIPHAATFSLISKSPEGVFATLHVSTPPESVGEFYESKLKSEGWETESRRSGDTQVITAANDKRKLIISIAGQSPGTHVTVAYSTD